MSVILYNSILFIHILLGVIWAGGITFVGWGVFPAIQKLNFPTQQKILFSLMKHAHPIFLAAGAGVILTGITLGTLLGPIDNWYEVWNTTYGKRWFSALVIAIINLVWGGYYVYKKAMKIIGDDALWQQAENGNHHHLRQKLLFIAALESIEVIGFVILIALMVLL